MVGMQLDEYVSQYSSVRELAQKSQVSEQAIYKHLDGSRIPRRDNAIKISHATGGLVSVNTLLKLDAPPPTKQTRKTRSSS